MTTKKLTAVIGIPVITIAAVFGGVAARNQYVNHDWKTFRQTEEVKSKLFSEYKNIASNLEIQINEQNAVITEKQNALHDVEEKLNAFNDAHKGDLTNYSTHNTLCADVKKAEKDLIEAKAKKEALTKEKEKNEKYSDSYKKAEKEEE